MISKFESYYKLFKGQSSFYSDNWERNDNNGYGLSCIL